ncbi:unnamed protein product [Phytophthora fragariaefolia]|uniref:Unnamed protein product n=1 Tax=Phytophthora fragariaefolia TaxID=1490495 RepID=A0A9W7D031_9STRA|nr:unnamed protein product [Phytophthora fragariaefolia]
MPLDSLLLLFKTKTKTKLLKPRLSYPSQSQITQDPDPELTTNHMGRAKRKWTHEAIEEALLQNARVNATPAEPEEAGVKRKRMQRRSSKKLNLLKELEALSVAGTEAVALPVVPVMQVQPIKPAQPTLEQEGKQEEDDPADHQRQFAAAYTEGQREAASETEPQVTRPSAADRAAAKRTRNAEQQRARRANMTVLQTERRRAKDRERQRARRARLTDSQRAGVRDADPVSNTAPGAWSGQTRTTISSGSGVGFAVRRPKDVTATSTTKTSGRQWLRARTLSTGAIGYHPLRFARCAKLGSGPSNPTSSAASRAGCNFPLFSLHPQDYYSYTETRNSAATSEHTTRRLPSPPSELPQATTRSETSTKTKVWRGNTAFTPIAFRGQWGISWGRCCLTLIAVQARECHPSVRRSTLWTPIYKSVRIAEKVIFADLDIVALQDIENMMVECNPFAQQFLSFGQKLREDLARGMQVKDIRYVLHSKPSESRTYNLPTVSEVGVAMVEDGNLTRPRDLYVVAKDLSLLRLFETDEKYDPLQYPLLFPYGNLGWTYTDVYANGAKYRNKRRMSLREHVAYRLSQKVDDQAALHQGGRLFQQWVVDQRAKCEQEQLRWVAMNQKKLRAELYHGISDALLNEETVTLDEGEVLVSEYDRATGTLVHPDRGSRYEDFLNQVDKRIVLPDSHSGSPQNMYKHYQESMPIVREYGKPDAFITMTCNPKWVEIIVLLPDEQTAQDRPDIVARVWQLKVKAKLADPDECLLGRLEARIYVVEFQKRGLPHAHIVIIVDEEDKPRTREIINKLVFAEVPDKEVNPDLYETVMTCMMHGPCGPANPGSPCMKDGKCTKGFPKPLLEVTQANLDGFPLYRRRRRDPVW